MILIPRIRRMIITPRRWWRRDCLVHATLFTVIVINQLHPHQPPSGQEKRPEVHHVPLAPGGSRINGWMRDPSCELRIHALVKERSLDKGGGEGLENENLSYDRRRTRAFTVWARERSSSGPVRGLYETIVAIASGWRGEEGFQRNCS